MGLNLCVYTSKHKAAPEWDSMRYAGDQEFADLIYDLPHEEIREDDYVRPTDFQAWHVAIAAKKDWINGPKRYLDLMDLLENNPDYWLYRSV